MQPANGRTSSNPAVSRIGRYLLVPNVLTTVVLLVTRLGGDTVSVMLNTMGASLRTITRWPRRTS